MNDLIVSINSNILKLSLVHKEGLMTASTEIPPEIVSDTRINDSQAFVQFVDEFIRQNINLPRKRIRLNFVVHPQDTVLRFITVTKSVDDLDSQALNEIREKVKDINLEEMYFSYHKIAPFVYQFVGTEKTFLDEFINIATGLNMELRSVVPWVMLMPKYLNIKDPAIFVTKVNDDQVVALTELNGIFYTGVFEEDKSSEELDALVKDLSIYKRHRPISRIYTLNYEEFKPENGFEVFKVDVPKAGDQDIEGYEVNMIVNYMLDTYPELYSSQTNMLNLFPLPVSEKSKLPVAYVGAGAVVAVAIAALVFGVALFTGDGGNTGQDALVDSSDQNTEVLAGNSEENQITEQGDKEESEQEENKEISKQDVKIRVENGAGINGAAGNTQNFLKDLGYDVIEIDTAESVISTTLLKIKESKADFADIVKEDTGERMPDPTIETDLDETFEYDLLIILGSNVIVE